MNIFLANMTLKNGNRGCVALCISTMYIIDQILTNSKIPYTFYLLDSGYKPNQKLSLHIGGKEIFYHTTDYPLISESLSFRQIVKKIIKYKDHKRNLKVFRNADLVLDIGQGDSFSDIYGSRRFHTIDRPHKMARLFKKPYCILPQTIGPFKDNIIEQTALESIERAELVMGRDAQSCQYIKDSRPNIAIKEYIDVAFFMPFNQTHNDDRFIHIGLNISGLLWSGGYTKDNQFNLKADYVKLTKSILGYFMNMDNVRIHLIGHVVEGERSVENDYSVCYDLFQEFRDAKLILAPFFLSPIDAKSYISGMDFFIGARMHATIAAFSSGVPVFPLAYSRKFNGLFNDTLSYHSMGDLKSQDNAETMNRLEAAFQNRVRLKIEIESRLGTVVREKGDLLRSDLESFLVGKRKRI